MVGCCARCSDEVRVQRRLGPPHSSSSSVPAAAPLLLRCTPVRSARPPLAPLLRTGWRCSPGTVAPTTPPGRWAQSLWRKKMETSSKGVQLYPRPLKRFTPGREEEDYTGQTDPPARKLHSECPRSPASVTDLKK